jgi:putative ABC transport system permease protein
MIRIAIAMLLGARLKFIGLITGVLFTSFLITHFQAMLVGIMTRTYAMIDDMPVVDVWVMDPAVEYVDETAGLPATALDRVRSVPGVAWATRFYSGNLRARLPGGRIRSVNVIGLDDASLVGFPGELTPDLLARLRTHASPAVARRARLRQLHPSDRSRRSLPTACRRR